MNILNDDIFVHYILISSPIACPYVIAVYIQNSLTSGQVFLSTVIKSLLNGAFNGTSNRVIGLTSAGWASCV